MRYLMVVFALLSCTDKSKDQEIARLRNQLAQQQPKPAPAPTAQPEPSDPNNLPNAEALGSSIADEVARLNAQHRAEGPPGKLADLIDAHAANIDPRTVL